MASASFLQPSEQCSAVDDAETADIVATHDEPVNHLVMLNGFHFMAPLSAQSHDVKGDPAREAATVRHTRFLAQFTDARGRAGG